MQMITNSSLPCGISSMQLFWWVPSFMRDMFNHKPIFPKKFSMVKGKPSEQLAARFSHANPQNCTAQPTTPDSPQRVWALCSVNQTFPCQCCLSHHRDMSADTDWGITLTPWFQFAVKLQPQESDLKRMCQTPLQGFYKFPDLKL